MQGRGDGEDAIREGVCIDYGSGGLSWGVAWAERYGKRINLMTKIRKIMFLPLFIIVDNRNVRLELFMP